MDEFPVGGGSGSGMGGGGAPSEEDYSKMPIEDRLGSKVWKARVSGYEELIGKFEKSPAEDAPIFKPYTRNPDLVKAMVIDSNAVAQEKALDAVKAFLSFGGKPAGSTRETVLPSLAEKCFGAMRAGTKKSALDIVSLYAESEDIVGCEGLVLNVIQGTSAKQPKVVATAVTALTHLVRDFGPKQVSFKPILKKLPDLFGHSDKNVRAEAGSLAQELHKWIGLALEPTLSLLKDIQVKELREQFAAIDQAVEKHTTPSRYLTSQRPVDNVEATSDPTAAAAAETNGGGQPAEEVDAFEFLDPKDPLKSKEWPENFDEMINSTKWLERKEVIDQCLKALEATPKIIHTPALDSIIDILSEKVKKDVNINVVLSACQCIQKFALGLRGAFAKNKDKALPALLEKLKERKESTVKVLADTLDAVFQTVSFSDILEVTLNATKHKNPQVKTGAIQFLVRCLRETRSMPAKADIKPIADALVAATADGSSDVRDAGAQGLGTLMKLIGERAMNQYIDGLDDIKKGKIQEQYKSATVKVKQAGAAPASRPAPAAAPPKPQSRPAPVAAARKPAVVAAAEKPNFASSPAPAAAKAPAAVSRGPPARLLAGASKAPPAVAKPAAASTSRPAPAAKKSAGASGSSKAAGVNEPVKYRYHPDEAEARSSEIVPAHIQEELSTSVWKDRLAAMVKFNEWLKLESETVESELIVRFLSRKPGWKESNFQVMSEVYNAFKMLSTDCPSFGRSSVAISIAPLCEKLGDIKLKVPAADTLMQYGERTSIGFVISQALTPLSNLKAPKAIADSLLWVNQALLDFGTANIDVRGLVDHLLNCLKSANAAVRTNATTCIGTLSRFLGPALTNLLGDINPQLRSTVEAEIEKASKEPAPTPTRTCEETRPKAVAAGAADEGPTGPSVEEDDALDALIPRVDLDNIIPSSAIAKLGDANWKERKEGLEEINAILDANTRLKPKMGELGTALKTRFSDNNVQVRTMALDALCKISTGMGKGFEGFVRTFVPSVTQVLADAKAPLRAAASKALTAMAEQTGAAPMISGFVSVLESKAANPTLRQDLFAWLGLWFEQHSPDKNTDLSGLAFPAIVCLDDKLAAVRKAAQSVLPFIIMRAGYKFVMEQTNSLKAASRNTVIPLIDAAKGQASSKAPPPPPPSQGVSARLENGSASSAPAKLPNVVRRAAQAPTPSTTDDARSVSSSTSSVSGRAGGVKAPTAVVRSLKAPANTIEGTPARLPRVGVRKTTYAPVATNSSSSSSNAAATEKSAPFVNGDEKFKMMREKREGGKNSLYWIGADAAPRSDLAETLRAQCEHHLSPALIDKMFSKDHNAERDYLSALTVLIDHLAHTETSLEEFAITPDEAVARIKANSDLLFKYVAIRLTDNNTSIALKCLDLLDQLIAVLRSQEYHMSDYEANAILPCVLAKFGDPKVAFRDRIRSDILRKVTNIYPPSKVLGHYMEEGLPSKNSRVRTECLAELAHLFHRYGTQICSLPKTMPLIAVHISDRDNGVRTGALMAISEVYKIVGDAVWQYVGELPLRDRGLLEERLRRVTVSGSNGAEDAAVVLAQASVASTPPVERVSQTAATPRQVSSMSTLPKSRGGTTQIQPPMQSRMAMPSRLARPASMIGQPGAKSSNGPSGLPDRQSQPDARLSRVQAPSGLQRPTSRTFGSNGGAVNVSQTELKKVSSDAKLPSTKRSDENGHDEELWDVEQTINEILSSDSDRSVRALKKLATDIQNCSPALVQNADRLAVAYGKLMHRAYGQMNNNTAEAERLKKHLMYTGTNIFDNTRLWDDPIEGTQRTLGSYVTKPALVVLLTELLSQLIGTKGATDAETQTQGRYLNIMVLRSFSSCNVNVLFGACLTMLTEATEDLEDLQSRGDAELVDKRVKFADLICKCIWKMTRKLTQSLQDDLVDAALLLQDLETFLQAIPPVIWKERAANGMPMGDVPLRTIKVIIAHIGNAFGEQALDLLEGIPDAEHSHVYTYMLRACEHQLSSEGGREAKAAKAPEDAIFDDEAQARLSPSIPSTPSVASRRERLPERSRTDSEAGSMTRSESQYSVATSDEGNAAELRQIFDRISNKSESRSAIRDLYLFSRKYPEKEGLIMRSLEQTGPIFQKFIKRAMANHALEDGEPSPFQDDTMTPRQSMLLSSPGAQSTASPSTRNSFPTTNYAGRNGDSQRNSYMSPSSSRTSNLNLAALTGINSSPSTPNSGIAGFRGAQSPTINSSPSANRYSVNDDRLAQLRAKFARSSSMQSSTAE
ncbi:ARM repeat-containing protein [Meira miltonrushii]|uniref:ARM repeat-containing protein n=1 Tax=Meira miltonrushii TaxID=1280837 RepID=A0A316VIY2_9BASI|nr:ARM repeat-containing protein [Meira miltonrushii]PWN35981.1 ARM repeat-containing protein [Meira miltonrushii]